MARWILTCATALCLVLATACSHVKPTAQSDGQYRVQKGETLASIAWRFRIKQTDLAAWNDLEPSANVKPGDRLRLRPPRRDPDSANVAPARPDNTGKRAEIEPPPDSHVVKKGEYLAAIGWRYRLDHLQIAAWNDLSPPYTIYPGQHLRLSPPPGGQPLNQQPPAASDRDPASSPAQPTSTHVSSTTEVPPKPPVAPKPETANDATLVTTPAAVKPKAVADNGWHWPVHGRIIRYFDRNTNEKQGIAIEGQPGTPVLAAAAGRIVYSGSGLVGYGRLVIIKHNERYISAYGHNRRLLVDEGSEVSAKQVIAELGSSGANRPMLHFEIRLNGQPIDPLTLLPPAPEQTP